MAERVIAVKMTLDANQTVESLDKVDKGLKKTDESLNKLNQDSQKLTAEDKLAALNKEVQSGSLSFRDLRKKIQDYQSIALEAGRTSPVGKQALQEAAALKDRMVDLDNEVKRLSQDGIKLQAAMQLGTSVVAGFAAFKGVTAALGVENEDFRETLVKLQGAQAALMGIEQIRASLEKESLLRLQLNTIATKAMDIATGQLTLKTIALTAAQKAWNTITKATTAVTKVFNAVLKANPIGLLITGIMLLIGAFVALKENIGGVKDSLIGFIQDVAKFFGLIEETEADQEKKRHARRAAETKRFADRMKEIDKEKNARLKAADETIRALELEKDTLEAEGKASDEVTVKILEAELEKTKAVLEANAQKIQNWTDYYNTLAQLSGKSTEDFKAEMKLRGVDLDELQQKADEILSENERQVQFAENRITKFKREQNEKRAANDKKHADERKKQRDKEAAEIEKLLKKQVADNEKAAGELFKKRMDIANRLADFEKSRTMSEFQIRKEALRAQYNEELKLLGDNHKAKLLLEKEFKAKLSEVNQEADKAEAEGRQADIDARNEQINQGLETAQAALEAAIAINEILNEIGERRKEKIQEERDADLAALDKQKQAELNRENLTAEQKAKIEHRFAMQQFMIKKQAAEEEDKIAKKQFQRMKVIKIAEIAINTAASVMQALGGFPPPASFIFAGINATVGTVQAALVAAQKFKGNAQNIQPPSFTPPPTSTAGATGGAGAGGAGGTGGPLQNDTITDTDALMTTKVEVSQVEINETQDQMEKVDVVSTL